jgi:tetratricopeptide (TPR) repeat protein
MLISKRIESHMDDIVIDIIDEFAGFQAVRSRWDEVYITAPNAQFFLSWTWLSGALQWYDECHQSWLILAARPSCGLSDYIAFFPLAIGISEGSNGELCSAFSMAGVAESDHIGFISLPEFETATSFAFARFIQQEVWSVFEVENIQVTDGRMSRFLDQFRQDGFRLIEKRDCISDLDQVDNSILPFIELPNDWEQYLQTGVSSNMRQKLRRLLRKIDNSNEFHFTQVNAENLELHLEILLGLWVSNWEGRKGEAYCHGIAEKIEVALRHCFEHQCLYLPVLWQGEQPLGAIANLLDLNRKTVLFFISSRDDRVTDLPPGTVLHAHAIQYAIEHGFKVYDFLMGNEAYKFSFGATVRQMKTVVIQSETSTLNSRTIPEAVHISTCYQCDNQLDKAEQGYRQILAVHPQHPEALYQLAVVMQRKGEIQSAEALLADLLQINPSDSKAWFSLGNLHQAQGCLSAAETAYQKALIPQLESATLASAIHHNLGYVLQQQDKWDAAIACYQQAYNLQPNSIEAEVSLANALYAQGKLSPEKRAHYARVNCDLGSKRQQAGDLTVALEYYRQSIQLDPHQAKPYYHLGSTLQAQGYLDEAIAAYQKAHELQPDYLQAEVSLANILYLQGNLSSEQQAHYAVVNYDLGNECQQADDLVGAIAHYRQSLEMNPQQADVQYSLGFALRQQGDCEGAIAAYRKAQEIQPDYLQAELGIAELHFMQDQLPPDAREYYSTLHWELGIIQQQSGNLERAIHHYRHAIALQPKLTEVRELLRLVLQDQNNIKIKVSCSER